MIWRLRDLPELQHLSPEDCKRLLHDNAGRSAEIKILLQSVARALVLAVFAYFVFTVLRPTPRTPLIVHGPSMPLAGAVSQALPLYAEALMFAGFWVVASIALYLFYMVRVRGQIRIALLEHLKEGGALPVCLRCGYGFEPPVPASCPECGAAAGSPNTNSDSR